MRPHEHICQRELYPGKLPDIFWAIVVSQLLFNFNHLWKMATTVKGKNGILPVPAAATRRSTKAEVPGRQPAKVGAARLRLIIRRLPPGLTEVEFWLALGGEWKSGLTKVDWAAYKPGKVSKEYTPTYASQIAVN